MTDIATTSDARASEGSDLAPMLRACIAACAVGAAAIHLAMVPAHMSEWAAEGVAFVLTGWLQLAIAALVMLRTRRWVLVASVISSAVFILAYLVTRTVGAPFGPQAGVREPAAFVDIACVVLEALMLLLSMLALWRPRLTANWNHQAMVFASIVPVAALVFATTAVTSKSASNHGHGCPKGQIAAPKPSLSAGSSAATTSTTLAADGHNHAGPACVPENDNGFSLLGNGHHHAIVNNPLDPVTQAELDRQLAITREVALEYPTVASAVAAGYRKAGPYSPGLGSHYTKSTAAELNAKGVMDEEALRHPLSLLYFGNDPDSELVGFMYYSISPVEPTGFVGTNDVWHSHTDICLKNGPDGVDAPFGADLQATNEQCAQVGGFMLKQTQWMIHVWTVPKWDNLSGGVFQEENNKLACSDGTYYVLPPDQWADNPINICRSKAPGYPSDKRVA
ncbi:MAG: hypothetical protein EBX39_06740 [Actinobacteria bacterium]|nr:hypothetical protein [Actinomycetota bacterium]